MANERPDLRSDHEFFYQGVRFITSSKDYSRKSGPDGVVLLKPQSWIETYYDLVEREKIRKVLELGVFQGGMSILMPLFEPELRYMGIEFAKDGTSIQSLVDSLPEIRDRVRIEFGTRQSDPSMPARVAEYFKSPELDLVIDDASHEYDESKRSFELFFPMLRPGAPYIVEDWGWAHWPNFTPSTAFSDKPALSNLLFEVAILAASAPEIVESVEVRSAMFVVRRGPARIDAGWKLKDNLIFNLQSGRLPMLKPSLLDLVKRKLQGWQRP